MANVTLPYGGKKINCEIPDKNLMGIIIPETIKISETEEKLITSAINNPIGTPRLSEMVVSGMKVVIIVDDRTRPTPVNKILPPLLEKLNGRGIPDNDITVVFALGTHVSMTPGEMELRAGVEAKRIKLFNSEFKKPSGLYDFGKAPDGVRVLIDKRVAEADFKIGVGSIMPHPECGWGGGAKIIYPGVAGEETVNSFHLSYANVDWNTYGSDKAPVRLNMEKWIGTVGLDFIVNTIITPENRVYQAVAGDYIKAHRMGIEYGRQIYSVKLSEKADIVLVTSFRADEDFWLASKALFAGELIIKNEGMLILVTPCPEGMGPHPYYGDYIGRDDYDVLLEETLAGKTENPISVSSAVAIAKMRKRFDIAIISDGLSPDEIKTMKCHHFASIKKAVNSAMEKKGGTIKIAVLPYGINTLPYI